MINAAGAVINNSSSNNLTEIKGEDGIIDCTDRIKLRGSAFRYSEETEQEERQEENVQSFGQNENLNPVKKEIQMTKPPENGNSQTIGQIVENQELYRMQLMADAEVVNVTQSRNIGDITER